MRRLSLLGVLTLAGCLLAFEAQAAVIVKSVAYRPVVVVDAASTTRSLVVNPGDLPVGETIVDVDLEIDFTKSDDPIGLDGTPLGGGFSYNGEIRFVLYSPSLSPVRIVNSYSDPGGETYGGQTPGARVSVYFDDEAALPVGGPALATGSFRPEEALSAFDLQSPVGSWTLYMEDTVGLDPLSLNAWRLVITTANVDGTVPEPASLAVFGVLGLSAAGSAFVRRRSRSA